MKQSVREIVNESVMANLLKLKNTLPIQRKEICYTNRPVTSPGIGDIILRPIVTFLNGDWEDLWGNRDFQKTKRGTYSLRVDTFHKNCPGYSVSLSKNKGQVCFSDKMPPADWTHFKVKGISKNGKSLFVEPVHASKEELISFYKKE